jgi:hypothetical protein
MTIKEIIAKEEGKYIFSYKQGAFWVCYEQSAYLFCLSRTYKPVKKFIKNCNQEVVTIGFPTSALEQWIDENTIETIEKSERTVKLISKQNFDNDDFIKWKNDIPVKSKNSKSVEPSLEKQILAFSLFNHTPVEAFLFLQKLQTQLQKT